MRDLVPFFSGIVSVSIVNIPSFLLRSRYFLFVGSEWIKHDSIAAQTFIYYWLTPLLQHIICFRKFTFIFYCRRSIIILLYSPAFSPLSYSMTLMILLSSLTFDCFHKKNCPSPNDVYQTRFFWSTTIDNVDCKCKWNVNITFHSISWCGRTPSTTQVKSNGQRNRGRINK